MENKKDQSEKRDFAVVAHGEGGKVSQESIPIHDLSTANNLCIIAGSEKCSAVVLDE